VQSDRHNAFVSIHPGQAWVIRALHNKRGVIVGFLDPTGGSLVLNWSVGPVPIESLWAEDFLWPLRGEHGHDMLDGFQVSLQCREHSWQAAGFSWSLVPQDMRSKADTHSLQLQASSSC
jgi:hypothetical protein